MSTNEFSQSNIISIYPNPSNDEFTFVSSEKISDNNPLEVIISDMTGKRISSSIYKNSSSLRVNVQSLHDGIYMVTFSSGAGTINKKIVVRH